RTFGSHVVETRWITRRGHTAIEGRHRGRVSSTRRGIHVGRDRKALLASRALAREREQESTLCRQRVSRQTQADERIGRLQLAVAVDAADDRQVELAAFQVTRSELERDQAR